MPKYPHYNLGEPKTLKKNAPVDQVKIDFANRLQRAMLAKGYGERRVRCQGNRRLGVAAGQTGRAVGSGDGNNGDVEG